MLKLRAKLGISPPPNIIPRNIFWRSIFFSHTIFLKFQLTLLKTVTDGECPNPPCPPRNQLSMWKVANRLIKFWIIIRYFLIPPRILKLRAELKISFPPKCFLFHNFSQNIFDVLYVFVGKQLVRYDLPNLLILVFKKWDRNRVYFPNFPPKFI